MLKERENKDRLVSGAGDTLYQVNGIAYMEADLKLAHIRILIVIIDHLQEAIRFKISRRKSGPVVPKTMLPVDGPLTLRGQTGKLCIKVSEFRLYPRNGGRLRTYLDELRDTSIAFPVYQKDDLVTMHVFQGLIAGYSFPAYAKSVEIYMQERMINRLLLTEEGYTSYSKQAAIACTNKYTVRLYWLICSWRHKGGFAMTLKSFRRILSLEQSYSRYDNIVTRILDPSAEELREHFPIWFLYKAYGGGDGRLLVFKVRVLVPREKQEEERRSVRDVCFHLLHSAGASLTAIDDLFLQVDYEDLKPFLNKVILLCNYMKEARPRPQNVASYIRVSLQAWLDDWRLRYDVIEDEP